MARPRKEIPQKEFENLCALQCTKEEICGFFEISEKTLNAWCRRTYGKDKSFSLVFAQKRGKGKISLRRNQFELSKKNANMAIWLGKQWLGQKEPEPEKELAGAAEMQDDPLSAALKDAAAELDALAEPEGAEHGDQ